jgi:hypothetical protein
VLLGDDFLPVEPVQEFLDYLRNIDRSPNTVRAYAYHLKLYWDYPESKHLEWTGVGLPELAEFMMWLDNQHEDAGFRHHPDSHHKHIFNWQTGDEVDVEWIGAERWLNLGEVIRELEEWYWSNKLLLPWPEDYPKMGLR